MSFNLVEVFEAVTETVPDREALVFREKRFTFRQFSRRSNRLANFLVSRNVSIYQSRDDLKNWQSGQDHVALYMYNCNEYLESVMGVMKARAVPYNVNYRYVEEELSYLLNNADTKAIIYEGRFASVVSALIKNIPEQKVLIQVNDETNAPLVEGAIEYEEALATGSGDLPDLDYSPDDLYMLYTGGTTGMPKGVLWRHGDILPAALGGRRRDGSPIDDLGEFSEIAKKSPGYRYLPTPPFMHGTGQWIAMNAWHGGNTVVIQDIVEKLDISSLLDVVVREKVNIISLVGDAFGRPLLEELIAGDYDTSSITHFLNGGAALSESIKKGLINEIDKLRITDSVGSSETGPQAIHTSSKKTGAKTGQFIMSAYNAVLSENLKEKLNPGHAGLGWFASCGNVPLGYLKDEEKTGKTFPQIHGVRYSLPGDKVKLLENDVIDFHGRESNTINSGGEKIFSEEVEKAVAAHSEVVDVLVSSRPSERWGSEVVAIVQLREGSSCTQEDLLLECKEHIARFKHPKLFIFVDQVARGANGKADYRWAKLTAENHS